MARKRLSNGTVGGAHAGRVRGQVRRGDGAGDDGVEDSETIPAGAAVKAGRLSVCTLTLDKTRQNALIRISGGVPALDRHTESGVLQSEPAFESAFALAHIDGAHFKRLYRLSGRVDLAENGFARRAFQ